MFCFSHGFSHESTTVLRDGDLCVPVRKEERESPGGSKEGNDQMFSGHTHTHTHTYNVIPSSVTQSSGRER